MSRNSRAIHAAANYVCATLLRFVYSDDDRRRLTSLLIEFAEAELEREREACIHIMAETCGGDIDVAARTIRARGQGTGEI